jgi:putative DNA methylase
MRVEQPSLMEGQLGLELSNEGAATHSGVRRISALESEFPALSVSHLAEHESWRKEVHRPASHTHKWWAQRLGTVFRAILASAVTRDAATAQDAYAGRLHLDGLTIFDPFAGSGTTLVEGAKLGATVIGWDINPVATLVQRQALQRWDLEELERAYKLVEQQCREEIDRLHRSKTGETVLYYFWVALADCPACGRAVRLFSNHVFAQHAYPRRYPKARAVCPVCLDIQETHYDVDNLVCANGHAFPRVGAVSGATMTCPEGHKSRILDALGGHSPRHEMYAKLVLGFRGEKRYEPADDFDRRLYDEATALLAARRSSLVLPDGALDEGYNTRQATRWGYHAWSDFFNTRQLYCLGLLGAAIRDLKAGDAEREALAALFSGMLEFNNLFCSFKGEGTGAVRHMFSHHILKPERTPLEAHPWGTPASSGSFSTLYKSRLMRAHEYKSLPTDQVMGKAKVVRISGISRPLALQLVNQWPTAGLPSGHAYVKAGDASATDIPSGSVDLVITDPPYMDNVHYSELADFFHAWLRSIKPFAGYPSDALTTRQVGEVQSTSPDEFEKAIERVWAECDRVMRPDGLLAFTFHQARISGWVALARALTKAHLQITAIQPIKGEMSTSVTKAGAEEPSNLDSIIVCRKRGFAAPFARTPEEARNKATAALSHLKEGGVLVGPTDARSVARGCVLSLLTNSGAHYDLEKLVEAADQIADEVISALGP